VENEVHRDIGRHDAQIDQLQRQVETLHADMRNVLGQLQKISSTLAEARGGWRVLLAVGGLASVLGAGLVKVVSFLVGR